MMEDFFMFEPGWSRDCHPNRWRRDDQDFEIETEFEARE